MATFFLLALVVGVAVATATVLAAGASDGACVPYHPPEGSPLLTEAVCGAAPTRLHHPHFAMTAALSASLEPDGSFSNEGFFAFAHELNRLACNDSGVTAYPTLERVHNAVHIFVQGHCPANIGPHAEDECYARVKAIDFGRCLSALASGTSPAAGSSSTLELDPVATDLLARFRRVTAALQIRNVSSQLLPYAPSLLPVINNGYWYSCNPEEHAPGECAVDLHRPFNASEHAADTPARMFLQVAQDPTSNESMALLQELQSEARRYFCGDGSAIALSADSSHDGTAFLITLSATCSRHALYQTKLYCGQAVRMLRAFRCALATAAANPAATAAPASSSTTTLARLADGLSVVFISEVGDNPQLFQPSETPIPNISPMPADNGNSSTLAPRDGACLAWDPPDDDPIYSVKGGCAPVHDIAEPRFAIMMQMRDEAASALTVADARRMRLLAESFLCNLTVVEVVPEQLIDTGTFLVHFRVDLCLGRAVAADSDLCRVIRHLMNSFRCLLVLAVAEAAEGAAALPEGAHPKTLHHFDLLEALVADYGVVEVSLSLLPLRETVVLPPANASCIPAVRGPVIGCALPPDYPIGASRRNVSFFIVTGALPSHSEGFLEALERRIAEYFCGGATLLVGMSDDDAMRGGFYVVFELTCTMAAGMPTLHCDTAAQFAQGVLCAMELSRNESHRGRHGFDAELHAALRGLNTQFVSGIDKLPDSGSPWWLEDQGDGAPGGEGGGAATLLRDRIAAGFIGAMFGAAVIAVAAYALHRRSSRARGGAAPLPTATSSPARSTRRYSVREAYKARDLDESDTAEVVAAQADPEATAIADAAGSREMGELYDVGPPRQSVQRPSSHHGELDYGEVDYGAGDAGVAGSAAFASTAAPAGYSHHHSTSPPARLAAINVRDDGVTHGMFPSPGSGGSPVSSPIPPTATRLGAGDDAAAAQHRRVQPPAAPPPSQSVASGLYSTTATGFPHQIRRDDRGGSGESIEIE